MRILIPGVSFLLIGVTALAQAPGPSWVLTTNVNNPPLRRENQGTADNNFMYVFGGTTGNSGGSRLNDLWRFDGLNWMLMTADGAPGSPPARHQAGVAWDFTRNKLVTFGGQNAANAKLTDT